MTLVFFTYMTGVAITGLGMLLSETPVGPILIGLEPDYLAQESLEKQKHNNHATVIVESNYGRMDSTTKDRHRPWLLSSGIFVGPHLVKIG